MQRNLGTGMAYATINLHQPLTGAIKTAPVGFSWTTLFFGFIPALLRGHWIGALVMLAAWAFTAGLSGLVFPFIYNRMYIKHLIGEGYKAASASTEMRSIEQRLKLPMPLDAGRALGAY